MKVCSLSDPCPCGRVSSKGRAVVFGQCCGAWLESGATAPDAESLMRSRYSAFCLERADYLMRTWHPGTRPAEVTFDPGVKWLGLEVRAHRQIDADHAEVEFVARQRDVSGRALRLQERSRFVREGGGWLYVDGSAN